MTSGRFVSSIAWMPLVFLPGWFTGTPADPPGHFDVMITASGYEPGTLVARPGDIVRFVQQDGWAHNIEFRRVPDGASLAAEYVAPPGRIEVLRAVSPTARVGPMLIGRGRAYEIRIGEEMPPGEYVFGCSHHSRWRGRLTVLGK